MGPIDADALREEVNSIGGCGAEPDSWADGWDKAIDAVISLIEKAPTVETGSERHGKWIPSRKHRWHRRSDGEIDTFAWDASFCNGPLCELCGKSFCEHCRPDWEERVEEDCEPHFECSECGEFSKTGSEHFCSNCGAKMDGKTEEI